MVMFKCKQAQNSEISLVFQKPQILEPSQIWMTENSSCLIIITVALSNFQKMKKPTHNLTSSLTFDTKKDQLAQPEQIQELEALSNTNQVRTVFKKVTLALSKRF